MKKFFIYINSNPKKLLKHVIYNNENNICIY